MKCHPCGHCGTYERTGSLPYAKSIRLIKCRRCANVEQNCIYVASLKKDSNFEKIFCFCGIPWNFSSRDLREQKFFGIPFFVVSDVKNARDFPFFIVG
jgi:hypothetical protein